MTILAAVLGALFIASGLGNAWQYTHGLKVEREAAAQHDADLAAAATVQADLAECQAKVTPESLDAASRILAAAQGKDLADINLRAAVIQAMPQAMYVQAVIDIGSPQLTAADAAMNRCSVANTTGDSGRSGCAVQVPAAWAAAVAALESCPSTATSDP